jgi:uncharacterized protein YjiS (DUF1127 family)
MTDLTICSCAHSSKPAPNRFSQLLQLFALYRQRCTLGQLGPERLADLGVTKAEAEAESLRGFWDVPAHWRERRG